MKNDSLSDPMCKAPNILPTLSFEMQCCNNFRTTFCFRQNTVYQMKLNYVDL